MSVSSILPPGVFYTGASSVNATTLTSFGAFQETSPFQQRLSRTRTKPKVKTKKTDTVTNDDVRKFRSRLEALQFYDVQPAPFSINLYAAVRAYLWGETTTVEKPKETTTATPVKMTDTAATFLETMWRENITNAVFQSPQQKAIDLVRKEKRLDPLTTAVLRYFTGHSLGTTWTDFFDAMHNTDVALSYAAFVGATSVSAIGLGVLFFTVPIPFGGSLVWIGGQTAYTLVVIDYVSWYVGDIAFHHVSHATNSSFAEAREGAAFLVSAERSGVNLFELEDARVQRDIDLAVDALAEAVIGPPPSVFQLQLPAPQVQGNSVAIPGPPSPSVPQFGAELYERERNLLRIGLEAGIRSGIKANGASDTIQKLFAQTNGNIPAVRTVVDVWTDGQYNRMVTSILDQEDKDFSHLIKPSWINDAFARTSERANARAQAREQTLAAVSDFSDVTKEYVLWAGGEFKEVAVMGLKGLKGTMQIASVLLEKIGDVMYNHPVIMSFVVASIAVILVYIAGRLIRIDLLAPVKALSWVVLNTAKVAAKAMTGDYQGAEDEMTNLLADEMTARTTKTRSYAKNQIKRSEAEQMARREERKRVSDARHGTFKSLVEDRGQADSEVDPFEVPRSREGDVQDRITEEEGKKLSRLLNVPVIPRPVARSVPLEWLKKSGSALAEMLTTKTRLKKPKADRRLALLQLYSLTLC